MSDTVPATGRQLQSLVTEDGQLRVRLVDVPVPAPAADEVVVRVHATPINPSDLGLLLAMADLDSATAGGTAERPELVATVPANVLRGLAGRVGESLPVGNEGAGVVVATGSSDAAAALAGKVVAIFGGAMYADYRVAKADQCLVLHDGTDPRDGASCFVNPLTALGMVETMRLDGHSALVHTAAASNLGQMLVKICLADGVDLVNIVRRPEQAELLRSIGAVHVCDSSSPTFAEDLTAALVATGATVAFDAIGGGRLAGQILAAMEAAIGQRTPGAYNRYGSAIHKQVYVYGGLDRGPTELNRSFGMAWGIGGWLLPYFLQRVGNDEANRLRQRVVDELTTTFASHYTEELTLADVLRLENVQRYARMATGEKVLVTPAAG